MKAYLSQLLNLPVESRRAAVRPAALVLGLSFAAALAATWLARADERQEAHAEFKALAEKLAVVFSESMTAYEQALRGGVGLYDAFGSVSRSSWRTYVDSLRLAHNYPGIQGVGFAAVIGPSDVATLETAVRAEGYAEFAVRPPGRREPMTAIVYLEPEDWRNRRALGFDMYSDPVRREAMQRARDTGEAALSRRITLVQETDEDVQEGMLLYLPVYRQGARHDTIMERRHGLVGYVYAAFRLNDLLAAIKARAKRYSSEPVDIALRERDLSVDSTPLPSGSSGATVSAYQASVPLAMYGTAWTLDITANGKFEHDAMTMQSMLVLLIGSLVAILIALIVGLLGLGRETARLAAHQLGKEADIRRQAEQDAVLATRELAHRVKNSLSIVSAIASQTLRSSETLEEFDIAFRARLQGLSKVHDLLAAGRTYETELSALATEVLRPYQSERKDGVGIEGPSVILAPNVAVLLSIVLNELATNATKYGAWSTAAGSVTLTWRAVGEGPEKHLDVIWRERDGPPAGEPHRSGFGSRVIKFAIERTLGGAATSNYGPHEVRHEFTLPWGSLRDRS